jgi:hypothetical protein
MRFRKTSAKTGFFLRAFYLEPHTNKGKELAEWPLTGVLRWRLNKPKVVHGVPTHFFTNKAQREAALIQTRGTTNPSPCGHCEKGQGPWEDCVSVLEANWHHGCGNCQYSAAGQACTIRKSYSIRVHSCMS